MNSQKNNEYKFSAKNMPEEGKMSQHVLPFHVQLVDEVTFKIFY